MSVWLYCHILDWRNKFTLSFWIQLLNCDTALDTSLDSHGRILHRKQHNPRFKWNLVLYISPVDRFQLSYMLFLVVSFRFRQSWSHTHPAQADKQCPCPGVTDWHEPQSQNLSNRLCCRNPAFVLRTRLTYTLTNKHTSFNPILDGRSVGIYPIIYM